MKVLCKIPDQTVGNFRIETFEVSKNAALVHNLRAIRDPFYHVTTGTYRRLCEHNEVWMSNTQMERRTNQICTAFTGDVLIFGLGLGFVFELLNWGKITSLTVVEKSSEIIQMVAPYVESEKTWIVHVKREK